MICRTDISNLKTDILEKVGQKIIVKGSLGRSRTFEKEATIEKAYPKTLFSSLCICLFTLFPIC